MLLVSFTPATGLTRGNSATVFFFRQMKRIQPILDYVGATFTLATPHNAGQLPPQRVSQGDPAQLPHCEARRPPCPEQLIFVSPSPQAAKLKCLVEPETYADWMHDVIQRCQTCVGCCKGVCCAATVVHAPTSPASSRAWAIVPDQQLTLAILDASTAALQPPSAVAAAAAIDSTHSAPPASAASPKVTPKAQAPVQAPSSGGGQQTASAAAAPKPAPPQAQAESILIPDDDDDDGDDNNNEEKKGGTGAKGKRQGPHGKRGSATAGSLATSQASPTPKAKAPKETRAARPGGPKAKRAKVDHAAAAQPKLPFKAAPAATAATARLASPTETQSSASTTTQRRQHVGASHAGSAGSTSTTALGRHESGAWLSLSEDARETGKASATAPAPQESDDGPSQPQAAAGKEKAPRRGAAPVAAVFRAARKGDQPGKVSVAGGWFLVTAGFWSRSVWIPPGSIGGRSFGRQCAPDAPVFILHFSHPAGSSSGSVGRSSQTRRC